MYFDKFWKYVAETLLTSMLVLYIINMHEFEFYLSHLGGNWMYD